jgi:hypothetical protein
MYFTSNRVWIRKSIRLSYTRIFNDITNETDYLEGTPENVTEYLRTTGPIISRFVLGATDPNSPQASTINRTVTPPLARTTPPACTTLSKELSEKEETQLVTSN